jgi:hypothetical protein
MPEHEIDPTQEITPQPQGDGDPTPTGEVPPAETEQPEGSDK